ncbi:angiotensin-converting enzyme [Elysia marginata]|uniref:Angiotensin-converting enzyme n=1 Tax=Elysia marginata TaxID=1093978 RepID=A0AAV4H912_9GAST|nr:angiotensin-converting enzyme [Elysia marginata]
MWSQSWNNIADLVQPFQNKQLMDVTDEMRRQGYTTKRMFETAEAFFYSLGFDNMTDLFWSKSMLERPEGRDVVCHASAWDMNEPRDFRIKMCTTVNHEDFITIHHEMGHIQYYMQYKDQPLVYRNGANPGFHEAVGDTIALSVQTPKHLKAIGLLNDVNEQDKDTDINFLMLMALDKIAFLPFGYLIDRWRWSVFRSSTSPEKYNENWWDLRCRLQGISPAVTRHSDDFDPAAKYHIVADVPYIRYFVSFVIQFQFYKAACDAAGNTEPLYKCDFYNNKVAGEKLRSMLQLGSSKPWPEAMEKITGQRRMDAGPLLEYFEPLMDYLKKQNGDDYGWEDKCPENPPPCVKGGSSRPELHSWICVLLPVFIALVGWLK